VFWHACKQLVLRWHNSAYRMTFIFVAQRFKKGEDRPIEILSTDCYGFEPADKILQEGISLNAVI